MAPKLSSYLIFEHSNPSASRATFGRRLSTLGSGIAALVLALTTMVVGAQPASAQDDDLKAQRQKKMEERRAERQKAAVERREQRNDPEFVRERVWWNDEETVEALELTTAQRKKADVALTQFLDQRDAQQEKSRAAQAAFFEALESGAADIEKKKDAMISTMADANRANAELRIAVMSSLNAAQRKTLSEEMPRILRANWADAGNARQPMQRRRPRGQGNNPGKTDG